MEAHCVFGEWDGRGEGRRRGEARRWKEIFSRDISPMMKENSGNGKGKKCLPERRASTEALGLHAEHLKREVNSLETQEKEAAKLCWSQTLDLGPPPPRWWASTDLTGGPRPLLLTSEQSPVFRAKCTQPVKMRNSHTKIPKICVAKG